MRFRRMLLPVVVLALMAAAGQGARAADDIPGTCADNFSSGTPCQGPDADPSSSACWITTWVVRASCELRVPGGVTHRGDAQVYVFSESDQTPAYDVKIVVPSTGETLAERSAAGGRPGSICDPIFFCFFVAPWNEAGWIGIGASVPSRTTDTVLCEIDSTWTHYGAPFAPIAEASAVIHAATIPVAPLASGPNTANNSFQCSIS